MAYVATYGSFKHGQNIHRQSVIYGAHNDVIIHEEISSTSESEDDRRRIYVMHPITPVNMPGKEHRPAPSQRKSDGEAAGCIVEFGSRKRAGFRRRRRFMNDYFLEEQGRNHLPENLEEAKDHWHKLFAPQSESIMQLLFEDEEAARKFEPYVEITMDKEEELLKALRGSYNASLRHQRSMPAMDKECPILRYKRIPKEVRQRLRYSAASDDLMEVQTAIVSYLQNAIETGVTGPPLDFIISDGYDRLLAHAAAVYYNLYSYGKDVRQKEGPPERHIYMKYGKRGPITLPRINLIEYLQMLIASGGYFSYEPTLLRQSSGKKFRKRAGRR